MATPNEPSKLPHVAVTVAAQQRYACSACGCVYRMERSATGEGALEHLARKRAREALVDLVEGAPAVPCPSCGLARPDKVAAWHAQAHGVTLLLGVFLIGGLSIPP